MPGGRATVVVPCYEEALNIRPLCERLNKSAKNHQLELSIILVDDFSGKGSQDTEAVVNQLSTEGHGNINLHIRLPKDGKGLSSAVILGLSKSETDVMLVMDADLQHEPESVASLLEPILSGKADMVFGSRHVGGGDAKKFSLPRKVVSVGATLLARGLTRQTDPMSGFFALRKKVLVEAKKNGISPLGYKIGLEILVRSKVAKERVVDVPISFQERVAGESKLTPKQYILYLMHLFKLYWFLYQRIILLALILAMNLGVFLVLQL